MTLGLAITAAAVAWLGTTTGVAALFASAVPLRDRHRDGTPAPAHGTTVLRTPVRSLPLERTPARPDTAEDDASRER
ncbi:hypothetical protein [Quadrisphaera sp. INWT6]|uniref:hypothetical protein n=1 Tax=Quadrisphaera sp. INWT6 TaxID=2596917 RepID=UPI0018926D23|nr:hypothetical protein [Quadrisphaera sp. INWT6]MBF5083645.1 hypothetical protein [Quadrisphaera sp. INWT6]